MKYEGDVYGKLNGRYIKLTQTVKDLEDHIKELIDKNKRLQKAYDNLIIDINSGNIISIQKT